MGGQGEDTNPHFHYKVNNREKGLQKCGLKAEQLKENQERCINLS